MRDYFIKLWKYTAWANNLLIDKLEEYPIDEALRLINHIIGAQDEWLSRFDPSFERTFGLFDDKSLPECREGNRHNIEAWIRYLESLDEGSLLQRVDYRNLKGDPFSHRLSDLVAHGINHSTHHRAQIAQLLRQAGQSPPGTDIIYYLRATE